ncbi:MAG: NAD-dependent epimerase/dehydratase family protein [Candidatus Omnitrophota bacterium]
MDLKNKKILVTGGTGKIGRKLVGRLIAEGSCVRVISRSGIDLWNSHQRVEIIKADLSDKAVLSQAVLQCEYVFHLAVHQDTQDKNIDNFRRVNIDGVRNVLNVVRSCKGLKKIIYVSTAMIFESSPDDVATEKWPQKDRCDDDYYLQTKIEALQYVRQQMLDLPLVVVYPTAVIDLKDFTGSAPARPGTIQYFLWEKIGGGIPGGVVNLIGPARRKFNYVIMEDLIDGLIKAATRGEPAQEYILSGHNISAYDYLRVVSKKTGCSIFPFRIPVFPFKVLAFLGRFVRMSQIVNAIARGDYSDRCFSSEKARKFFQYEARLHLNN